MKAKIANNTSGTLVLALALLTWVICHYGVLCVWLLAGFSSLTCPESDWLDSRGWVRLHTCGALSNQCAQANPAVTPHTLRGISDMSARYTCAVWYIASFSAINPLQQLQPVCWCLRRPVKAPRSSFSAISVLRLYYTLFNVIMLKSGMVSHKDNQHSNRMSNPVEASITLQEKQCFTKKK